VAEGGALLRRYTGLNRYRGFESLSLRHLFLALSLTAGLARAETFEANVVGVQDGDSLTVMRERQRVQVRLVGIDAPERKQAYGDQSRRSLATLCWKKRASIAWLEKDAHQRLLGRVNCSGVDANAEQVRRGLAWASPLARDREMNALQDAARRARKGLWADAAPVKPWEWRRVNR
jgi:endonuclease YncB( thermonuclease family)